MEKLDSILCLRCLKRQFGKAKRNRKVKKGDEVPEEKCQLCKGAFLKIPEVAAKAIREFDEAGGIKTFAAGTAISREVETLEEKIWDRIDLSAGPAECIKAELNRELGKQIERTSKYKFAPAKPDARIIWDTRGIGIAFASSPTFISGRYKKLERFIRQTRREGSTEESVEALIGDILARESKASKAILHGAGREDVDALMLGEGRLFIMELKSPKVRNLDLKALEKKINSANKGKVQALDLRYANQGDIEVIKRAKFSKTYEALVEVDRPITASELKKLDAAAPILLMQRTPTRVLNRRADLVRKRQILSLKSKAIGKNRFKMRLDAESGTYVKEFISSDEGRTKPSVSELLGTSAKCIELNVLAVHSKWYEDWW
jgi:tRNA pseudouridine synthase 10